MASESTPLLSVSPSEVSLAIAKHDAAEPYLAVAREEARWMASASSLTVLALLLQFSFYFANVMSVSHLGATELAAMSVSVMTFVAVAMAPMMGYMIAMDTFCANSFTASSDKTMVGLYLQRGLVALAAHFALVAPVMWNTEWILLSIGQDPAVAQLSGTYLRIQTLGVIPWAAFEACMLYLQAQGIMGAGTVVAAVVAPVHWTANYLLVRSPTYGIGFVGAPIVTVASQWLSLAGILAYIRAKRVTETWGGWDARALRGMGEFYRLAIPSVVTSWVGWCGYEMLTLGSSYFGPTQLAASAIMFNTINLVFQVSQGLGLSVSPRVGNLIGAAKPRQARIAGDVAAMMSVLVSTMGVLSMVFFGGRWISVYTKDPVVAREAGKLIPVACMLFINDGLNGVLRAVLRGLGRQSVSAVSFTIGNYACAVPVGYYLGFHLGMGVIGVWWGLISGVMFSTAVQLPYLYAWIDWKGEVLLCRQRLQRGSGMADLADPGSASPAPTLSKQPPHIS